MHEPAQEVHVEEHSVLVVDDDPQVRSSLSTALADAGIPAIVAATAEEALALADGIPLLALVTELCIPGMGGLALMQRLSTMHPNARFIATANAPVDFSLFPKGHRTKFLSKPVNAERVLSLIRQEGPLKSSYPPAPIHVQRATNLLLVEDSQADAALFSTALRIGAPDRYEVTHVSTLAAAQKALAEQSFDIVCVDMHLPDSDGPQTVIKLISEAFDVSVVVISHSDDEQLALKTVQAGAQDFLVKGKLGPQSIVKALKYARERKTVELRLSEMALKDPLTDLANRTSFRQRVARAVSRCRRSGQSFAVLLVDLDRFKPINDNFGHDVGDAFLTCVAKRLRDATRPTDLVARLGGDEFALLLDPVPPDLGVEELATRILDRLRQSLELGGTTMRPSASIGVALFPDAGRDCDSLLAAADAAMYAIKENGRNSVQVHGKELGAAVRTKLLLEQSLRRAVQKELFQLHYQPIVGPQGYLLGVEALLRWPRENSVEPAERFIGPLEDMGLVAEVGPWVLNEACLQLQLWRQQGCHVPSMSINVSPAQFLSAELADQVKASLDRSGLRGEDIMLEITERTLLSEDDLTRNLLGDIANLGCRIALDDFGTGYSSLAHLNNFPITDVKIDRSLVRDISESSRRRALVGAVLGLASSLGLGVAAEGVENEVQAQVLRQQGCKAFQGFLYGRPTSAEDFQRTWSAASA